MFGCHSFVWWWWLRAFGPSGLIRLKQLCNSLSPYSLPSNADVLELNELIKKIPVGGTNDQAPDWEEEFIHGHQISIRTSTTKWRSKCVRDAEQPFRGRFHRKWAINFRPPAEEIDAAKENTSTVWLCMSVTRKASPANFEKNAALEEEWQETQLHLNAALINSKSRPSCTFNCRCSY